MNSPPVRAPSGPHGRLVDVANPRQVRTVISYVRSFHREVLRKRVLQIQGPVPDVRRGQIPRSTVMIGHGLLKQLTCPLP